MQNEFIFETESFQFETSKRKPIQLPPIIVCGKELKIVDGFRSDQSSLRKDSVRDHFADVNAMAKRIVDSWKTSKPIANVCCEGNADAQASKDYNFKLGLRRANTVRTALINAVKAEAIRQGRPDIPAKISFAPASSGGEDFPVADNSTEAGRLRNRRVEVYVAGPVKTPPVIVPGLGTCLAECDRAFKRCLETGNTRDCMRAGAKCKRECRGIPV